MSGSISSNSSFFTSGTQAPGTSPIVTSSSFFTAGGVTPAVGTDLQSDVTAADAAATAAAASASAAAASAAATAASAAAFAAGTGGGAVASVAGRTGAVTLSVADVSGAAPLASPALTGTPTAPTPTAGDNSATVATTAFVAAALGGVSYTLPTASTTTLGGVKVDGTTITIANGVISSSGGGGASPSTITPSMDGTAAIGTSALYARADHVHPTDTSRASLASPTFTGTVTIPAGAIIAGYAPLASPALTGTPTAPTAIAGTSTTQLATTAFVGAAITAAAYTLPTASTTVLGGVKVDGSTITIAGGVISSTGGSTYTLPTASTTVLGGVKVDGTTITIASGVISSSGGASPSNVTPVVDGTAAIGTSALYARADHAHPTDTSRAPLASPALTGTPTAPTAAAGTNTTQVATTAYVQGQASSTTPAMDGTAAVGTGATWSRADHVHPTDTSRAPLASPALTGTPTVPTATAGTNTTQAASTAFVGAAITAAAYTLPTASTTVLGGVKVDGTTVTIASGVISAAGGGGASPSTTTPLMDGTAAIGTSALYTRADHVHPSDTSSAPLASPALTGTPTAPTPAVGDNTTKIATTAALMAATASTATISTTGGTTTLTAAQYGVPHLLVTGTLTSNAVLVVPNSGVWTVSNQTSGSFGITVQTAAGTGVGIDQGAVSVLVADGTNVNYATSLSNNTPSTNYQFGYGGASSQLTRADHVHPQDTSLLASPAFTGTPTAPTPAATDNSTNIATTAFVANRLAAPPAIGGTTPAAGKFTTLTSTTSTTLKGITSGTNQAAGNVGEYLSSTVVAGSAVGLTTATPANVTSLSLTAGDWDVWGQVAFTSGATTNIVTLFAAINTTSATLPVASGLGMEIRANASGGVVPANTQTVMQTGLVRVNISSTTTVYMVAEGVFSVSTLAAFGTLAARRVI